MAWETAWVIEELLQRAAEAGGFVKYMNLFLSGKRKIREWEHQKTTANQNRYPS